MIDINSEGFNDTLSYIKKHWSDISDQHNCARYVLRNEHRYNIDQLCGFWIRNEHV